MEKEVSAAETDLKAIPDYPSVDPIENALQYVRSPKSKALYSHEIGYFLKAKGLTDRELLARAGTEPKWAEEMIVSYIKECAAAGLAGSTIATRIAATKALLDYNDVVALNWKKIRKALPPRLQHGKDRAPTIDEVRRMLRFAGIRERALVLAMSSGGFKSGALDYLSMGDLTPIGVRGKALAGKLVIYRGEAEEYVTFVSPEALEALGDYLDARRRAGEDIEPASPLFRDAWDISLGASPEKVVRLASAGAKSAMQRIFARAGLQERDFKELHGFRKFFKTNAERGAKSIYVEALMGHSMGVTDSYFKPTDDELLQEYLKCVPYLAVSKEAELSSRLQARDSEVEALRAEVSSIREAVREIRDEREKELRKRGR